MKYAFGRYILDEDARELRDGDREVKIEPKVFDMIHYLIECRDRVVSKDELVAIVWNGRFVSDSSVSTAVKAARRVLGDDGRKQRFIRTFHGHGFRFVEAVTLMESNPAEEVSTKSRHDIRFCRSKDGTRIACALCGQDQPLLLSANWLHHLEFDWTSPVWRHFLTELSSRNTLIRYDQRGNGLSSWDVSSMSLENQIEDQEAVVEAVGLDRFNMVGLSQGCLHGLAYAARHPDMVDKLVLIGGYTRGWAIRDEPDGKAVREASIQMMKQWWGKDNPAVRQIFSNLLMPDAPPESHRWFNDLQKMTTSPEIAVKLVRSDSTWDIRDLLPAISAETLVIHARHDATVPYEEGQELAAAIPGARFVTLESRNHILPASDPAWRHCAEVIREFLAE